MKKNYKMFICVFLTILCIFVFDYLRYEVNGFLNFQKESKFMVESELKQLTGDITSKNTIKQQLLLTKNNFDGLEIFFSTNNRKNTCNLVIDIIDNNTNQVVRSVKLKCEDIKDNSYRFITFESIKDSKQRDLSIVLRSEDATEGNAITAWYNPNNIDRVIRIADKAKSGSLVFNINYRNTFDIKSTSIDALVLAVINLFMLNLIMFLKK